MFIHVFFFHCLTQGVGVVPSSQCRGVRMMRDGDIRPYLHWSLPGACQPSGFLKCKLICGSLVEPFVDWSTREVFCPKGEGVKCICKVCRNCYGGLSFGSAYTCHRVNKAPWEDSGLAEHLGHTLSKLSPRCACRTDSPSASCHAQNVYPICQDNLSSNKLRS